MKNITVSLPADIYRRARIKAAEQDTSVSALVREFLWRLANDPGDVERRRQIQDDVIASITAFRAGDRLSRSDVHRRRRAVR